MEGSPLFRGLNQYARYSKLFMTLVKDNMDELNTMGVGAEGIGTHSFRKGVATMVTSG